MVKKYCPYCQSELEYLNVVRERALEWNEDTWESDPKAIAVIQCPECGDELECIDLSLLGIPTKIITSSTKGGNC